MNINELYEYLATNLKSISPAAKIDEDPNKIKILINKTLIQIERTNGIYSVEGINYDRTTIFNLANFENCSVLILIIKLLTKGYSASSITLEKKWQTGRDPIYLDVFIKDNQGREIYMIEVKTDVEFQKIVSAKSKSKVSQLFSYAMQERNTKIASFYAFDFVNKTNLFANVFCSEIRTVAQNVDDFYDRWEKVFDTSDFIDANPVFNIRKSIKRNRDLKKITNEDTDSLFKQFLTILRLNSISDKPNAFMKMINLFLSKIADEDEEDNDFRVIDKERNSIQLNGVRFQYIEGIDTPESFMKRLGDLYKLGMENYLRKQIIDYSDDDIDSLVGEFNRDQIVKAFDNLRLKKNNNFSFIEVYDDKTFEENFCVVRDIVKILENYKLKYEGRHQFLGDFFENLLNTSLKQEAGQFFTPTPLVDFMVNSLEIEERISKSIEARKKDFIPAIIDYACGAGHFLVSAMRRVNEVIEHLDERDLTKVQIENLRMYKASPYIWAKERVVGIEKDYRLAKTTKIAGFLNGDGEAEIIAGDGINKFDCVEYKGTILETSDKKRPIFDYVISNPPYSVDGFMQNFVKNGIDEHSHTFTLLRGALNLSDSAIEIYFVERMEQLLCENGIGAIILPQSILSQDKYRILRKFILNNFKILSMLLTADLTFSGTSTSPVILFLRKQTIRDEELNYNLLTMFSPKYKDPSGKRLKKLETEFLGYEFSDNRDKSRIKVYNKSDLGRIESINRDWIQTGDATIPPELRSLVQIVNVSNILLNGSAQNIGDIYPKRLKSDGKPLSAFGEINYWKDNNYNEALPEIYLEIGDLNNQVQTKNKTSKRYCKENDILISSLVPSKNKIVIAKGKYMLTTAIHVLTIIDDEVREKVFKELREDYAINQMHALLDGFKVTYSKISEHNLRNNVYIDVK